VIDEVIDLTWSIDIGSPEVKVDIGLYEIKWKAKGGKTS
jgi:hypothetical protein